jgi:hypothetical protein
MENRFIQKIPLNPPLPKGEDARKDSRQAGMTAGLAYIKMVWTIFIPLCEPKDHDGLSGFAIGLTFMN